MILPARTTPVEMVVKTLTSLTGAIEKPGEKLLIFQCYGGTHSSVTAASIYLDLLPRDRIPTNQELTGLPYFDQVKNDEVGPLRYMGRDRRGNKVYILGSRRWGEEVKSLLQAILPLLKVPPAGAAILSCFAGLNWVARTGGFISRQLGIPAIGRPLVCYGIRLNYRQLIHQVELLETRPDLFALTR